MGRYVIGIYFEPKRKIQTEKQIREIVNHISPNYSLSRMGVFPGADMEVTFPELGDGNGREVKDAFLKALKKMPHINNVETREQGLEKVA